jgi:hypothetical protein
MSRKWFLLVSIFLIVVAVIPAFDASGNGVLAKCQTAIQFVDNNGAPVGEHFDSGWCIGWVAGALQLSKLHNDWATFIGEKPALLQFCLPDSGIPAIQAARVVVKYLKEHTEQLHEDGMSLTIAALKDSFPCTSKK